MRSTKIVESKDLSPPLFIEEVAAGRRSPKTLALVVPTGTTNAFSCNNIAVTHDSFFREPVIPIRSETSSTMLVAISHALCRRRLHRVGCEKQALSMDLAKP